MCLGVTYLFAPYAMTVWERRGYSLSGSPKQMRKVLHEKLRLDGVYCEHMELKDNLRNILRGRFRAIKEQVGFKLPALLSARSKVNRLSTETLFGDDAERDAFVYSLYADLVSGSVNSSTLEQVLDLAQIFPDSRLQIYDALDGIEHQDCVQRIFIHLNRLSPPIQFEDYGCRLVPIYNYLQASLILMIDGRLKPSSVWAMAQHFTLRHRYNQRSYVRSLDDLMRRRLICSDTLRLLKDERKDGSDSIFDSALDELLGLNRRDARIKKNPRDFEIDYVGLLKRDLVRRRQKGPLGFY